MTKPQDDNTQTAETNAEELDAEQLQQVSGGLLLPAVQKVREAASRTKSTETFSLSYEKK